MIKRRCIIIPYPKELGWKERKTMGTGAFKPKGEPASAMVYQMLAELSTAKDVQAFMEDLCTLREIEQIAQRMECAQYLLRGETYLEIIAKTDISSTTLSRISRCIQHGSGGYSELLRGFLSRHGLLTETEAAQK